MVTFTEAQLTAWLSPLIWPFLRTLAVFTSAPIFSSRAFPVRARIALAFFVALAAQPSLEGQTLISINDPGAFGAVVQQVGIGLVTGFAIRVVFAAVELAGEVVGFQMALGFASFFDPSIGGQSSTVARFFGQMAAFMFIVMNGHVLVHCAGWAASLEAVTAGCPHLETVSLVVSRFGTGLRARGCRRTRGGARAGAG